MRNASLPASHLVPIFVFHWAAVVSLIRCFLASADRTFGASRHGLQRVRDGSLASVVSVCASWFDARSGGAVCMGELTAFHGTARAVLTHGHFWVMEFAKGIQAAGEVFVNPPKSHYQLLLPRYFPTFVPSLSSDPDLIASLSRAS